MCTAIVSSRGIFPVDGSARGEDFYLATRGDFSLATRGDLEVATREDFFMAMDTRPGRGLRRRGNGAGRVARSRLLSPLPVVQPDRIPPTDVQLAQLHGTPPLLDRPAEGNLVGRGPQPDAAPCAETSGADAVPRRPAADHHHHARARPRRGRRQVVPAEGLSRCRGVAPTFPAGL